MRDGGDDTTDRPAAPGEGGDRDAEQDSAARLAAIVAHAEDAIVGASLDGTVTYWSPSAERMYRYAAEEVIGRPASMLAPPERRAEMAETFRRLSRGEAVTNQDGVRVRKDGTRFDVSVTLSPVWRDGAVMGAAGFVRDVSEKKRLEARLSIADRMASVGTIAAGVAHEINNPLAAIVANLDHLREELGALAAGGWPLAPTALQALLDPLDDARASAVAIRDIVRDLKLFSRGDDDVRSRVEVEPVLESSARIAWNEVRHRARVVRDYGRTPPVLASENRLGQVFLNLVVNAAQAIPEGAAERNAVRLVTRTDARGWAVVEVRDTGAGIPEHVMRRMFEPFFTTKPTGVGTGLGLPICQRLVTDLGGAIECESRVGHGTTFRVSLPPAPDDAPAAEASPAPAPAASAPRRGAVLVVDDDVEVATAVRRTLKREHDVVIETRARDALARLAAGERFDVILCDLMMPDMTGMQLHEELSRVAPDVAARVVFFTGGAFTADARRFLERVPNLRLEKPFDPLQLRAVVRERLR